MEKQCAIYGNRLGMEFKFKFILGDADYLEQVCCS